jgi:tRNA-intron endonuclease
MAKAQKDTVKKKTTKSKTTTKKEKIETTELNLNVNLHEIQNADVEVKETKTHKKKEVVDALFAGERILMEKTEPLANELYSQNRFGTILEDGKLQLSLLEALYLFEKNKIRIVDGRKKEIPFEKFLKKAKKLEPNFWIRYVVFKNMRTRGYIIKTALKFGGDFRVYDRGIKPGEDHAKWIVYPAHEGSTLTWYDFAAKARVAHSTKKRLLMAIVDDENDVTYYEIKWTRP